ncbi:MAG: TonB-dependent receptor [Dysgonamonadaceae bacterium]|nr:TonB-dependent receptor [Dysgonamonadaceae bacterium]
MYLLKGQEIVSPDSTKNKQSGESERNVMLNASSANGPRQISIGLPSEDVSVYENGLPTVYSSALSAVSTHWRADASLKNVGLMPISETAIATGNIAYAVNSFSNQGTDKFQGKLNYNANHFGLQRFDLGVSGKITDNWLFAGSVYQNFDPGSFDLKFTNYHDRTALYKFALTRKLGDKGILSLQYKHANSYRLDGVVELAPFIYVGDGSVKEVPGFSLGTSSYIPVEGRFQMLDMRSGKISDVGINDESKNKGHELMLNFDYTFDNGFQWKFNAKAMKTDNRFLWIGAPALANVKDGIEVGKESDPDAKVFYNPNGETKYNGMKQNRMAYFHYGNTKSVMITSELLKTMNSHQLRLGVNQWYYDILYWSNTTRYDQTVAAYPQLLSHTETALSVEKQTNYAFNNGGSEYYDGYENKSALYLTDNWDITDKWNLYLGGRAEYYRLQGKNLPYNRFENFWTGADHIAPKDFSGNYFNYSLAVATTCQLTKSFGFTADVTTTTRRPRIEDYATPEEPSTAQTQIVLGRAGLFFNNNWLSLTSLVSYIQKNNNRTGINISHPNPNMNETKGTAFNYDISTIGWTTDFVAKPFRNFNLHFLFTYQKPTYKKFETDIVFSDGTVKNINATGNIVTEIPQVLIEIDPSYTIIDKATVWASFRYFSKTYANLSNALYFNGHWETFGGVNYKINDKLSLGLTVINFFNQTGAIGTIAGSELMSKEEVANNPQDYQNRWMTGKYIRPFTLEFSASIKF